MKLSLARSLAQAAAAHAQQLKCQPGRATKVARTHHPSAELTVIHCVVASLHSLA